MTDNVSAIRNQVGKATLGILSALLIGLLSWGGRALWGTKLDVDTYKNDYDAHLKQDALDHQLDSVWHAEYGQKIDEALCAVKPRRRGC